MHKKIQTKKSIAPVLVLNELAHKMAAEACVTCSVISSDNSAGAGADLGRGAAAWGTRITSLSKIRPKLIAVRWSCVSLHQSVRLLTIGTSFDIDIVKIFDIDIAKF
jgi:hypothetical protein